MILYENEFVDEFFDNMVENDMDTEFNIDNSGVELRDDETIIEIQPQNHVGEPDEVDIRGNKGVNKPKRRANLTEFGESLTTKRKNESAKRELTSIVNQVSSFLHSMGISGYFSICS